jgi:hypothetical protein
LLTDQKGPPFQTRTDICNLGLQRERETGKKEEKELQSGKEKYNKAK